MSSFHLQRLGHALRDMRKRRGLTQKALSESVGIPRAQIIQIEHGAAGVAAGTYARVAHALGAEMTLSIAHMPTLEEAREFFDGDE